MVVRVGVFGAGGRMGQNICRAVVGDPELELVAAVDPAYAGIGVDELANGSDCALEIARSADAMPVAGVEVAVDFTQLSAARQNMAFCAENGLHAVVGTSGFVDSDFDDIRAAFSRSNCLIGPNFAIGAVLMMRFAEMAAPFFETAEIVELHHDGKVDSPSGTALATAEVMAAKSDEWADDPTTTENLPGARGAVGPGGIPIHSVRMRGMTAHQEVMFGTEGQSLTVRHDSYDRSSFMPGVLLAVKRVREMPGLTIGLGEAMGL